MRWKPRSLRSRLALWYAAMMIVTLVAITAVAGVFLQESDESDPGAGSAPVTDASWVQTDTGQLVLAFMVGLPPALLLAIAGGLWLGRVTLAPIEKIATAAASLDADHLERRVPRPPDAATEVGQLADALNQMLDRMQRSVETTRRFTADASHELRTPLAVLRTDLEVELRRPRDAASLRAALERSLGELGRMSRLVDALLILARGDAGELAAIDQPVRVDELVSSVVARHRDPAAARRQTIDATVAPEVVVAGDPGLLDRALTNLVDNAVKYGREGGHISVAVSRRDDGGAEVVVDDDGPGLSDVDRERCFERFFRGERSGSARDGAGLGLAIARTLVELHGGHVEAGRAPIGGARFRVALPSRLPQPDVARRV